MKEVTEEEEDENISSDISGQCVLMTNDTVVINDNVFQATTVTVTAPS